jgi:CRP-like cAMP-binding protein
MSVIPVHKLPPTQNRILASLPPEEYQHIIPHLEYVHLSRDKIIADAGDMIQHAYFPLSGMISLLSVTADGQIIEVAMVGNEGVVGLPIFLRVMVTPFQSMVQIPSDAVRIRADALRKEIDRSRKLEDLLLRYTHAVVTQITQSAVCNRFHTVEERLCRWLLVAHDRIKGDHIALTQECISHMLGTTRTGVTMAAGKLQDAGLIHYRRGKISLTNMPRLEAAACECYTLVKESIDSLAA